jgi:hypothetical protein
MIRVLRWISVVPACIAAWYVALFTGIIVHSRVFSLCPPELVAYGVFCDAKWFPAAERAVMCFGAALAAVLVVLTATVVAPSHRILISRVALGVGTIVAVVMAVRLGQYAELLSAVCAGALATLFIGWAIMRPKTDRSDVA